MLLLPTLTFSQVSLPTRLKVVEVDQGVMVLRADGLYEARLTLTPCLHVPYASSIEDSCKSQARKAGKDSSSVGVANETPSQQQQQQQHEDEDVTSAGPPQPQRWRWLLLSFVILPNSYSRSPLEEPQVLHLLQDLNNRISQSTDAAAYKVMEQQLMRRWKTNKEEDQEKGTREHDSVADMMAIDETNTALKAPNAPSVSVSGVHSASVGTSRTPGQGHRAVLLAEIEQHAADEATRPLVEMHAILSDISVRLLIDASACTVQQLASRGYWEGHAQLHPASSLLNLTPGLRINYWHQAVPLLDR
jgi:hypothetical protein